MSDKVSKTYNILLIGASGAGKSTLINSIPNYQKYLSFDGAKNNLKIIMPAVFSFYSTDADGNPITKRIEVGEKDKNENFNTRGESVTQRPKQYSFEFNGDKFNIIDTPGLSDSRGLDQDKINLDLIREEMKKLDSIHGICIVLKSNQQKLGSEMETCLRDLFSLFPKSAVDNIFYLFTHCRGTFMHIGDAINPLMAFAEKFKASHDIKLQFVGNRMFCSESEPFQYLIALQNNYHFREEDPYLKDMWSTTANNISRFLDKIKNITPIKVADIEKLYYLESLAFKLGGMKRENIVFNKAEDVIIRTFLQRSMSTQYITFRELWSLSNKDAKIYEDIITDESLTPALRELETVGGLKDDARNILERILKEDREKDSKSFISKSWNFIKSTIGYQK